MASRSEIISGCVNAALLDKADCFFKNDDDGVWIELLQNARRAGAQSVDITVTTAPGNNNDHSVVTMWDDGHGLDSFQDLLMLGHSGWDDRTQSTERPAGIGFFCLCRSQVLVQSGHRAVTISPAVFLGKETARVEPIGPFIRGTRLHFTRESPVAALKAALERVTLFCPLEVRLNGEVLPHYDFLEGALHRELIDGIEVGFSTEFKWHFGYRDLNWNFYGARIHEPFPDFKGIIVAPDRMPETLHARFNVLETSWVKLQLPDRRSVIQDPAFDKFVDKAKAAAYRFFATLERHALSYTNWREAKQLGVTLSEAAPILTTWHARPMEDGIEPVFGRPEQRLLSDLSDVILVEQDEENEHTLAGAFQYGAALDGALYEPRHEYAGYRWYQDLARIAGSTVFIDDVPFDDWPQGSSSRPEKIEIELRIARQGQQEQKLKLPALIHVAASGWNEIDFVAVRNSPWDNDDLSGPFSIVDFLMAALLRASDDLECDSWATQQEYFQAEVEREVNEYFRGPRATLLALLRNAIDWNAHQLAEQLAVQKIHFERTASGQRGWEIALDVPDVPEGTPND